MEYRVKIVNFFICRSVETHFEHYSNKDFSQDYYSNFTITHTHTYIYVCVRVYNTYTCVCVCVCGDRRTLIKKTFCIKSFKWYNVRAVLKVVKYYICIYMCVCVCV